MSDHVTAVQKMQEYIENHLSEEITLSDLSSVSCYSAWHTHRIFVKYLSLTPATYIRKLRLSKSASELYNGQKITDVAFLFGFGSVDGFQRAFYKEFKINPKEFAKQQKFVKLFIPEKIKEKKEEKNMENKKGINFFALIICFILGIGSGIFIDSKLLNKQLNIEAYSGKQVVQALNSSYSSLKDSNIITNNNVDGYLVKTNTKSLSQVVETTNSADAFIVNEGSVLRINSSTTMEFSNLSETVFRIIGALFNQGSYDLMSNTLLFEVRDADVMPPDFDLKMKMVGFQGGIGFEYYLTNLSNTSEMYDAIYIQLDESGNATSIFYASVQSEMIIYGAYDIVNNQTLSLNPEYAHIDKVEQEIMNMFNIIKYSSATLKTNIDIVPILFPA